MMDTYRYEWRAPTTLAVSAETAGTHLEAIRKAHGGRLTPGTVVEESRNPTAPLHPCFEWRDDVAAGKYREEQARHLITNIVVVQQPRTSNEPVLVRAFHAVQRAGAAHYTHVTEAMTDDDYRGQVLARALKELRELERRYKHLSELADVFDAMHRVDKAA